MSAYVPQPRRVVKHAGIPIIALVIFGVLTMAVLAVAFRVGPEGFSWALLPVAAVIIGATFCYLWLDRWEPEPARLLLGAFLWGGGVAAGVSLILNTVTADLWPSPTWALAVGAPLFEETTKGLFFALMLTGSRRRELNSLTDALVYAGMVGLGFAFVEDMLYFAQAEDAATGAFMFVLRMLMSVFAHPLFTSMTALGVWFAVRSPRRGTSGLWIIGGWMLALLCHGIWNGSTTFFNGAGFFLAYGLILVPLFAAMVWTAVASRRNEGRQVVAQLPQLVSEGTVYHSEALWLGTLDRRRQVRQLAGRVGGRSARRRLRRFSDSVTELALLRTRMIQGGPTARLWQDHQAVMAAVAQTRAEAMDVLAALPQPAGPPGPPRPTHPGPQF